MGKVALRKVIWQGDPHRDKEGVMLTDEISGEPIIDRVELQPGDIVPKTVPMNIQMAWEEAELVYEDPDKKTPDKQLGPPHIMTPIPASRGVPLQGRQR